MLVLLADTAPYARVYVPEPVRVQVGPGTTAVVTVDGVAQTFEGKVRTVSSEAVFTPFFAVTMTLAVLRFRKRLD